jgi:plastocyanin
LPARLESAGGKNTAFAGAIMKAGTYVLIVRLIVFTFITINLSTAQAIIYSNAPRDAGASAPATRPASQAAVTVKIENFAFLPKELDIVAGTTVIWQNADDVPHTATSKDDPQVFDSGPLDTDDKFAFTFSKPGKYAYYCKVHPHMTGVVVVK